MRNTYKLIWSDEALNGLKEIIDYIERKFSEKDVKKFKRNLKEMGYKVQIVEELASYDLFELESEEL